MPPVNLDDVPEPEEPPPNSNLVSGISFSHRYGASRPRAQSDSFRRLKVAFSSSPPSTIHEDHASRPPLLRTMSPKSNSRRKMYAHSRSHSSPPTLHEDEVLRSVRADSRSNMKMSPIPTVVKEDGLEEEKQEDGTADFQQKDGSISADRPRTPMYSEGSIVTDDDETATGFDFDSPISVDLRRASIADTGPRQHHLFGYALPLWCTTRPNARWLTTCIAKNAPCFWFRQSVSLTTTNQAILMRLGALCGFLGKREHLFFVAVTCSRASQTHFCILGS